MFWPANTGLLLLVLRDQPDRIILKKGNRVAINTNNKAAETAESHNPHRRLHKIIFICAAVLLTGQVLEGSFLIPFICVYFGYPDISLTQVCSEMEKMAYHDNKRYCNFPYPLFASVPEPWTQGDSTKLIPPTVPPRQHFRRLGFREILKIRKERLEKEAAEARAAKNSQPSTGVQKMTLAAGASGGAQ